LLDCLHLFYVILFWWLIKFNSKGSLHKYLDENQLHESKQTNIPSFMTKGSELTDAEKGAILALRSFKSYVKIEVQLDIPHSTSFSFVIYAQKSKSIENLPRPGRPWKLSDNTVYYFARTVEGNSHILFKELPNLTNINASVRTIRC